MNYIDEKLTISDTYPPICVFQDEDVTEEGIVDPFDMTKSISSATKDDHTLIRFHFNVNQCTTNVSCMSCITHLSIVSNVVTQHQPPEGVCNSLILMLFKSLLHRITITFSSDC